MKSTTIRMAICDDDHQALTQTVRIVNDYFNPICPDKKAEVHSYSSSLELLDTIGEGQSYDIYLLDVLMPGINGIELAKTIRVKDSTAKIIFLSSSSEFALDSYAVEAFHYLLKPVQKEALVSLLKKICQDIFDKPKSCMMTRTQSGLFKVLFQDVLYVEVIKRTTYFYLKNALTTEVTQPINQIEAGLLVHACFVKPHRSYIVNLDYVKALTKDGFLMVNDRTIPISRNVYKEMKQRYMDHAFLMSD